MGALTKIGSGKSREVFTDTEKPGSIFKIVKTKSRNSLSNRQEFWVWKFGGAVCPELRSYLPEILSYEVVEDKLEMKKYDIPVDTTERKKISGKLYRDLKSAIPGLLQRHVHKNNIALNGDQPILIDLSDLYKLLKK